MIGWIVAAWLAGMVVLLVLETKLARDEWLALFMWPVSIPFVATPIRLWLRWRTRCGRCGKRWGDHEALVRHIARDHSLGPVPATEEHR